MPNRSVFGGGGGTSEQDATRQLIEAALQQTQQGPTFAEDATNQLIQAIMGITAQPNIGQLTPGQTDIMSRLGGIQVPSTAVTPFQQDIMGRTSELYQNPLSSGIFQALLQPVLAALVPSERAQRQSLTDRFRATGQSGSGAFAQAARQQESDIFNQRGQVTSNLALQSLQQLLGALQGGFQMGETQRTGPMAGIDQLVRILGQGFQQGETQRQASLTPVDLLLRALQGVSPIGREAFANRNPLDALSRIAPIAQQTAAAQNAAQQPGYGMGSGTPSYGRGGSGFDPFGMLSNDPFASSNAEIAAANQRWENPYLGGSFGPSETQYGYPASDPRSSYYDPSAGFDQSLFY